MRRERLRRSSARLRMLLGAVAVGAALTLAACGDDGGGGSDTQASSGGGAKPTLTIGLNSAPASLDPALDGNGTVTFLHALSNEPLIHRNAEGELEPALAESWGYVGEGNRTFELTLRDDARFSDGTPVDAEAVKGWLEYFTRARGPFSNALQIGSIETSGSDTVTLNLASPNAVAPLLLSEIVNMGFVSSPAAVARPRSMGTRTAGAGPYMLDPKQTVTGSHYTFVPNPHYYDPEQQRFGKVVVRSITEPTSMLQAAKAGQLDVAWGDASTAASAEASNLEVLKAPAGVSSIILMDRRGEISRPLANPKVRQAMNYALDRETFTRALMDDYGAPSSEMLTLDGFDPEYQDYYEYDPEKARQLLAEAGYPDGFTFRLLSSGWNGNRGDPLARAIAQDLKDVGITMDITTAATFAEYNPKVTSGDFPTILLQRGGDPMPMFYALFLAPDALLNLTHAEDPEMQALLARGQVATPEEAPEVWKEMSRRTVEDAQFLPALMYDNIFYVNTDRVRGVELNAANAFAPLTDDWMPAGDGGT